MSCLGGVCWNKHAMGVRFVCMSVAVAMGASVNVFHHRRWMVRARTLSRMCAGMLRTHLMRLVES
jgi:hypothetical protein